MDKITKRDINHLEWIYHRMTAVHDEKKNVDYMIRFLEIINKLKSVEIETNYDHIE